MFTLKLKNKEVSIELIDAPGMAKASFPITEHIVRQYRVTGITLLTGLVEYAVSDLVDGMEYPVKTDRVIVSELPQILGMSVSMLSQDQSLDDFMSKLVIDAVISRSDDFEGQHAFLLNGNFNQPLLIKSVEVSETGTVTTTMVDEFEGAEYSLLTQDESGFTEFRSNSSGRFNTVPAGEYTLMVIHNEREARELISIEENEA